MTVVDAGLIDGVTIAAGRVRAAGDDVRTELDRAVPPGMAIDVEPMSSPPLPFTAVAGSALGWRIRYLLPSGTPPWRIC